MQTTTPSALSDKTIAVVKSTAPVLEQHGELLTRHFYARMFRENPEVKALFNSSNQGGTQQKALAGAICAFAANVDRLEALASAVERIAQKHAGLGIQPEHYPVVGANLLASIREVLGEAATDDIIDAWAEAYGFLANILIGREGAIYRDQAEAEHGWAGFKPFTIARKQVESEVITSFYLKPVDDSKVPSYKPGQYLTVRVPDAVSGTTMRNYSLSSAHSPEGFRISVKAEPSGSVSGFLHAQEEGTVLEIGPPCGEFFLDLNGDPTRPLVLISGGVGITPTLAMLETALKAWPEREIVFIHGALNGRTHAFRDALLDLSIDHPLLTLHTRYSSPTEEDRERGGFDSEGYVDGDLIASLVPRFDGDYYFCGPKPFMIGIYRQLAEWGVAAERIHFEFFGPRQELEA
ncbi:NO-inducible flavohemoprotein [Luteolibacter sp. LG18]|uniref:NO-inducible flavohemoprotein n=1 Tax=Luteolibacter sp. LG18 TaxID=2819286 RepID=UPI0030C6E3B1